MTSRWRAGLNVSSVWLTVWLLKTPGTGDGGRGTVRALLVLEQRDELRRRVTSHESRVPSHALRPRVARITQHTPQVAAVHVVDFAGRRRAGGDRFLRGEHHAFGP